MRHYFSDFDVIFDNIEARNPHGKRLLHSNCMYFLDLAVKTQVKEMTLSLKDSVKPQGKFLTVLANVVTAIIDELTKNKSLMGEKVMF